MEGEMISREDMSKYLNNIASKILNEKDPAVVSEILQDLDYELESWRYDVWENIIVG